MGYSKRNQTVIDYWPDDDENTLYICADREYCFVELMQQCKDHFGSDVKFDDLSVSSQYIHSRCVTYDLRDPSDHNNFIVITRR